MHWPPDLADDLPAPRDDEPASLRQDIADELADHLTTAFHCEQHRTADEAAAKGRVLDRFGDPRKIARKLWFDALSEKIMSQRLLVLASVLMTVTCLAATGLGWVAFREGREVNAAILARLEELASNSPEPTAPNVSEWLAMKVRLVLDTANGPPAAGYRARLDGHIYGGASVDYSSNATIEEICSETGEIDFGLLSVGRYFLTVTTPWGETTSREVGVRPGRPPSVQVICPSKRPLPGDVEVSVEWPDDIKSQPLYVFAGLTNPHRNLSGAAWSPNYLTAGRDAAPFVVRRCECPLDESQKLELNQGPFNQLTTTPISLTFTFPAPLGFSKSQQRTEGDYSISQLIVLMPADGESTDAPRSVYVLGHFSNYQLFNPGGPNSGEFGSGMGGGMFQVEDSKSDRAADTETVQMPFVSDGMVLPLLSVRAGQANHWRILLPAELVQQVRDSIPLVPKLARESE